MAPGYECEGEAQGDGEGNDGVLANLFESYAAACRTGAEVDDGSDSDYEVRAACSAAAAAACPGWLAGSFGCCCCFTPAVAVGCR